MSRKNLPAYAKQYEPWSALHVEPLVLFLTPILARWRVHPNVLTLLSLLLGLSSGLLFALGHWIWGAIAFQTTYIPDCLDGKVARLRQITSEFGAKLDNWADYVRKPSCFLGIAVYFYSNDQLFFVVLTALTLFVHVVVHKLYVFLDINHCDLEFPNFHRKIFRRLMPRAVALYTFFEEQNLLFIVSPLVAGFIGLPQGGVWFFWGAAIAIGLCFLKLIIVCNHRRKGRYAEVHQDWAATKGNLNNA